MFGRASYINTRKAIKSREKAIEKKKEEIAKLYEQTTIPTGNPGEVRKCFDEIAGLWRNINSLKKEIEAWKQGRVYVVSNNFANADRDEYREPAEAAPPNPAPNDEVDTTDPVTAGNLTSSNEDSELSGKEVYFSFDDAFSYL